MFFTPRRLPTEQIHSRNSCPIYVLLIQTCKAKNPGICLEYSLIFSESNSVIFFPHLPMNRNVAISDFCPRLSCRSSTPDCPPLLQPFLAQIPDAGLYQKRAQKPHQMLHAHPQDLCISNMCSCVWVSSSSPNAYAALWYPASIPGRGRDSSDSSDSSTVVISSSDSESVRLQLYECTSICIWERASNNVLLLCRAF